ncbi:MAG: hypothetical protein ABW187_10350 [Dokdonella sp.]
MQDDFAQTPADLAFLNEGALFDPERADRCGVCAFQLVPVDHKYEFVPLRFGQRGVLQYRKIHAPRASLSSMDSNVHGRRWQRGGSATADANLYETLQGLDMCFFVSRHRYALVCLGRRSNMRQIVASQFVAVRDDVLYSISTVAKGLSSLQALQRLQRA